MRRGFFTLTEGKRIEIGGILNLGSLKFANIFPWTA